MKTTIYLIRHGETTWNVEERVQGCYAGHDQSVLTKKGKEQARLLRKRLSNVKINYVYSSPLTRAMQTARIVFPRRKIIPDERLKERCFGEWEGLLRSEIERKWPGALDRYAITKELDDVKGVESIAQISTRCTSAINEIVSKHSGKRIAVVTHGGPIRYIITTLMKLSIEQMKTISPGHTSITILVFEDGNVSVPVMVDHSHLES